MRSPPAPARASQSEFLKEERRTLGEWWYRQEYECHFLDAQSQAFSREDIERAFDTEVRPWDVLSSAWT